jgi:hypothetical protein
MKNKAILSAGKTKPTRGTKIAGKNAAVIVLCYKIFYLHMFANNTILYIKILENQRLI